MKVDSTVFAQKGFLDLLVKVLILVLGTLVYIMELVSLHMVPVSGVSAHLGTMAHGVKTSTPVYPIPVTT
jgi:tetrahydromethanopterin S-methyltransferase subunit D